RGAWKEARGEEASSWAFPDFAGALWKFPALRPPADLRLAAEPERPSLPGPEEIAFVSNALRAERERAALRMARPFSGAASEEAHALLRDQQAAQQTAASVPNTRPGTGRADAI